MGVGDLAPRLAKSRWPDRFRLPLSPIRLMEMADAPRARAHRHPRPRHRVTRRLSQGGHLHRARRAGDGQNDLRKSVQLQSCRRRALSSIPELRRCRARPRHRGNRCRLVRNSALLSIIAPSSGRGSLFTGSGIPAAAPLIIPSLIGEGRLGTWAIVAKQTKSRDHLFGLVSFRCCMEGSVCHRWAGATWRQES